MSRMGYDTTRERDADLLPVDFTHRLDRLRRDRAAWLSLVDDETTAAEAIRAHEAVKRIDVEIAALVAVEKDER